jgi:F0F1-type ATP synthase membrane subunit b/b'
MTDASASDDDTSDAEALLARLKRWFREDSERQAEWRRCAREDFAFTSGDQLDDKDKAKLREMNRPVIIMNRIEPVIDSVSGSEVANRQEVQFLPRTLGEVQVNEVLTSAARWFRDQCDAEDEESDAFRDTVVCGMGWTETRLDYEDEPDGAPKIERVDPLEMVWDSSAKKRNLSDMRRLFHVRRDIPIDEARALCPGEHFEDADYNAAWVDVDDGEARKPRENDAHFYNKDTLDGAGIPLDRTVTMVRAQWWERLPVYLVLDPTNPDNILTLSRDAFRDLEQKLKIAGGTLQFTTSTRKVYKQAFLGRVVLEIGDAPCREHFSFKCITGKRDRNKNTWYGLVRAMKDPQRWANKWMSQTMHIMNTTAKGGIAAERGAFFDDEAEGEASWAKQDTVTYLRPGALSGPSPKFIQKPTSPFPQSSFELMQFAINSIRDVSGVNVEILGMQSAAGQAASLDLQRKQAAMTILQPLFDSLRRYRKEQGRLLLYLIENYLSDGRLIRVVGPDQAQYVPLIRQGGVNTYDVIVDEAPTSPNQKEATWAMLTQLLPVIGKMLPPATWLALMKYSPLPTSAQRDISDSLAQQQHQQQGQPDPEQARVQAELGLANAKAQAEIANHRAMTEAKIDGLRREAAARQEIEMRRAQAETLRDLMAQAPAPDGAPAAPGPDAAALVMSLVDDMRRDMAELAASIAAPKQIVRDPHSGEITAVVPMKMN